ncbi:MAG: apolipoprotein N-acyltransferase [Endomicrobium sp.]|nr:apolipoprotein N-acyltransferase [Endomicrobium sp.]
MKRIIYRIIIPCVSTGLLTVCAFPRLNLFFLMWVSFIPLISATMKANTKYSFFYGFISGGVFNVLGLYWIIAVVEFSTGIYCQTIIVACVMWIYLSLYWGVWSFFLNVFKKKLGSNILIVFSGSCIWILLEYVRTYFLTGFPWMLVGYSQFKFTAIIQIAEFTGVYGVSFIVIFWNLCFYFWISNSKQPFYVLKFFRKNPNLRELVKIKNKKQYLWNNFLTLGLIFMSTVLLFGAFRINKFKFFGDKEFSVAIVQPNIDQYKKWDRRYKNDILSALRKLAVEISKTKCDLVLWPETVFPASISEYKRLYDETKFITKTAGGFNIVGSLHKDENGNLFNSVFAFEHGRKYKTIHKKNHLIPFGEYIPFESLFLKFLRNLNQVGDFVKGTDANIFNNGQIYLGAIICSENFFPNISRRFALAGAKVLTNHTNDAWFLTTPVPDQHFVMNIFRAIETRKVVLVSANSGISGIIEPSGIITVKSSLSKNILLTGCFSQNNFQTFYTKHGDLFIYLCSVLLLTIVFFTRRMAPFKCIT